MPPKQSQPSQPSQPTRTRLTPAHLPPSYDPTTHPSHLVIRATSRWLDLNIRGLSDEANAALFMQWARYWHKLAMLAVDRLEAAEAANNTNTNTHQPQPRETTRENEPAPTSSPTFHGLRLYLDPETTAACNALVERLRGDAPAGQQGGFPGLVSPLDADSINYAATGGGTGGEGFSSGKKK